MTAEGPKGCLTHAPGWLRLGCWENPAHRVPKVCLHGKKHNKHNGESAANGVRSPPINRLNATIESQRLSDELREKKTNKQMTGCLGHVR